MKQIHNLPQVHFEFDSMFQEHGIKKTRAKPPIYWQENRKETNAIEDRTTSEWRKMINNADSPNKPKCQKIIRQFKKIPEREKRVSGNSSTLSSLGNSEPKIAKPRQKSPAQETGNRSPKEFLSYNP